jgi:hypothetical protein
LKYSEFYYKLSLFVMLTLSLCHANYFKVKFSYILTTTNVWENRKVGVGESSQNEHLLKTSKL